MADVWAIRADYSFEVVKVERETEKMVFYWPARERPGEARRGDKRYFLDYRGDEQTARRMVEKLKSAKGEADRRRQAASVWFTKRKAEILAEETGK